MSNPAAKLEASFDDIRACIKFMALASQLRPRIGSVLDWDALNSSQDLSGSVTAYIGMKGDYVPTAYAGLMVRVAATFERFLRDLVECAITLVQIHHATYENIPATLRDANVRNTGVLLGQLNSPRDHLLVDYVAVICNLATCIPGNSAVKLNPVAFSARLQSGNVESMSKALDGIGMKKWADGVFGRSDLKSALGTKKARETASLVVSELDVLWRRRNNIAHGGDEAVVLTDKDLLATMHVVQSFAAALSAYVLTDKQVLAVT